MVLLSFTFSIKQVKLSSGGKLLKLCILWGGLPLRKGWRIVVWQSQAPWKQVRLVHRQFICKHSTVRSQTLLTERLEFWPSCPIHLEIDLFYFTFIWSHQATLLPSVRNLAGWCMSQQITGIFQAPCANDYSSNTVIVSQGQLTPPLFFLSSPAETSLYSFHSTQFACLKSRCFTSQSFSSR